jgi:hypothetical protein
LHSGPAQGAFQRFRYQAEVFGDSFVVAASEVQQFLVPFDEAGAVGITDVR